MAPNLLRSISPAESRISTPNASTTRPKQGCPFSRSLCATLSASTIVQPLSCSIPQTVDLPLAIPPVSPILNMEDKTEFFCRSEQSHTAEGPPPPGGPLEFGHVHCRVTASEDRPTFQGRSR